jgi:hypothetical protein
MSKNTTKAIDQVPDEETALAIFDEPTDLALVDLEAEAGAGREDIGIEDVQLPFLKLLQKSSPQCDAADVLFIEEAKQGQFINSVTNELFAGQPGVPFIPCYYVKKFVEWAERDNGKRGPVDSFAANSPVIATAKPGENGIGLVLPNGNDLVETDYHYGLALTKNGPVRVQVSASSTKLKKSKRFNTLRVDLQVPSRNGGTYNPPSYGTIYLLSSVPDEGKKGKYFNIEFTFASLVQDASLLAAAKAYREEAKKLSNKFAVDTEDAPAPARDNNF